MKKTLLIAAAALAAGVISSQAQVYSQNVVGYVNLSLTNGSLAVVAPALDLDGTGTNNTVGTVFPTATSGDVIYAFNGTGYDSLNYGQPRGATSPGWYFNGALANTTYSLNPGQAVFYVPSANETLTIVGTVLQGTNIVNTKVASANAISLVSSPIPLAGGITSTLQYPANSGDIIYVYNGVGYTSYSYGQPRGATSPNWYSGGVTNEPQVSVGSGLWLQPSATTTWTQNFTVQ